MINLGIYNENELSENCLNIIKENEFYNVVAIFNDQIDPSKDFEYLKSETIHFIDKIDVLLVNDIFDYDEILFLSKNFNIIITSTKDDNLDFYYNEINKSLIYNNKLGFLNINLLDELKNVFSLISNKLNLDLCYNYFEGKNYHKRISNMLKKHIMIEDVKCYLYYDNYLITKARNKERISNRHLIQIIVKLKDKDFLYEVKEYIMKQKSLNKYKIIIEFLDEIPNELNNDNLYQNHIVISNNKSNNDYSQIDLMTNNLNNIEAISVCLFISAIYKMKNIGFTGLKTLYDIPLSYYLK